MQSNESLPPFIKGLDLSEQFYHEVVRPLLDQYFPDVQHSAARIAAGSDVLGFDTAQSRDHGWGPEVEIFVDEGEYISLDKKITEMMAEKLPFTFAGYPTHYASSQTASGGIMEFTDQRPINHRVRINTIKRFFTWFLDLDPEKLIDEKEWFTLSQQSLRQVTDGKIFHDGLERLNKIQETLSWYPRDIWIYLLSCQWVRLDQEMPFTARCGDVGDELGSRIVASRQIIELMRLCFLMEQRYWPYNKWFGTAFKQLDCSTDLSPLLKKILDASTWKEREHHLNQAYVFVADMHNRLGITDAIDATIISFHDRPYKVINAEGFSQALLEKVYSKFLKSIRRQVGSVNQFADSTDIFCWSKGMSSLGSIYDLRE